MEGQIEALWRVVEVLQKEVVSLKEKSSLGERGGGGGGGFGSPVPLSSSSSTSPLRARSEPKSSAETAALQSELAGLKQVVLRLDCDHGSSLQLSHDIRELQSKLRISMEQNVQVQKLCFDVSSKCGVALSKVGELEYKLDTNAIKVLDALPPQLLNTASLDRLIDARVAAGIKEAVRSGEIGLNAGAEDSKLSANQKLVQAVAEMKSHVGNLRLESEDHRGNIKKVERHFRTNKTKDMILRCRLTIEKHLKMFKKRLFFRWKNTVAIYNERKLDKLRRNFKIFLHRMDKVAMIKGFKKWKRATRVEGLLFDVAQRPAEQLSGVAKRLRASRRDWLYERALRSWVDLSREVAEERELIPSNNINNYNNSIIGNNNNNNKSASSLGSHFPALPLKQSLRNEAAVKRSWTKWKRFVAIQYYPESCYRVITSKCDITRLLPRGIDDVPCDVEPELATSSSSAVSKPDSTKSEGSAADRLLAMVEALDKSDGAVSNFEKNNLASTVASNNINTSSTGSKISAAVEITQGHSEDSGTTSTSTSPNNNNNNVPIARFGTFFEVEAMSRELIKATDSLKSTYLSGDYEVVNLLLLKYIAIINAIPTEAKRCMDKIDNFVKRFDIFEARNAEYIGDILKSMTIQFESNDKIVKRLRKDTFSKIGEVEEDTLKSLKQIRCSVDAIVEKSTSDMEIVAQEKEYLKNTSGRLDRLYLLHGELISKQDMLRTNVDGNTSRIQAVEAQRADEIGIRKHLQASLERFSMVESRVGVISNTTLPSMSNSQSSLNRSVLLLQDAIKQQRAVHGEFEKSVDATLNRHMLRQVSTQSIVSVYESFEKLVCEQLYLGKSIAFISGGPLLENKTIMRSLVDLSLNLAQQIANDVDKDSLYFLVNGSNPTTGGNSKPILASVLERRMAKVAAVFQDLDKAFNRIDQAARDQALQAAHVPPSSAALTSVCTPIQVASQHIAGVHTDDAAVKDLKPPPFPMSSTLFNQIHNNGAMQTVNSKHRVESWNLFLAKLEKFLKIGLEKYGACVPTPKHSLITKTGMRHPEVVRGMVSRCVMCDSCLDSGDSSFNLVAATTNINSTNTSSGLGTVDASGENTSDRSNTNSNSTNSIIIPGISGAMQEGVGTSTRLDFNFASNIDASKSPSLLARNPVAQVQGQPAFVDLRTSLKASEGKEEDEGREEKDIEAGEIIINEGCNNGDENVWQREDDWGSPNNHNINGNDNGEGIRRLDSSSENLVLVLQSGFGSPLPPPGLFSSENSSNPYLHSKGYDASDNNNNSNSDNNNSNSNSKYSDQLKSLVKLESSNNNNNSSSNGGSGGGLGLRSSPRSNADRRPSSAGRFSKSINSQHALANSMKQLFAVSNGDAEDWSGGKNAAKNDLVADFYNNNNNNNNSNNNNHNNNNSNNSNWPLGNNETNNANPNPQLRVNSRVLVESLSSNFLRDVSIPAQRNSNLSNLSHLSGHANNQLIAIRPLSASSRASNSSLSSKKK